MTSFNVEIRLAGPARRTHGRTTGGFGGIAMLPVAIFRLALVSFAIHAETPGVELCAGAHRTHANETLTRSTIGIASRPRYANDSSRSSWAAPARRGPARPVVAGRTPMPRCRRLQCRTATRTSPRRGSPDGFDTDLSLTLNAALGLRLRGSSPASCCKGRSGYGAINYYRINRGGKNPESSFLAGLFWRPG